MKLTIPKIVRPVALTDYAPELTHDDGTPAIVQIWINPPTARMTRHGELSAEATAALGRLRSKDGDKTGAVEELQRIGEEFATLFAELWSQHADPTTHWTAEEVTALANSEANPALYRWLTARTIANIREYRGGLQKK